MSTNKFKRIAIIGNSGSGKSTLANIIGFKLNLPIYHLDSYFYASLDQCPSDKSWMKILEKILLNDSWIIEGGSDNLDLRIRSADLVIFLDPPIIYSFWRCLKRYIMYVFGKSYLSEPYNNQLSWPMLKYVLLFNTKKRPYIIEKLNQYSGSAKMITIRSSNDVKKLNSYF